MTAEAPPQPTGTPAASVPDDGLPDVSPQAVALAAALATLLGAWATIAAAQKSALVAKVAAILAGGRTPTSADLDVDTSEAKAELLAALVNAAGEGARLVAAEAKDQGVMLTAVQPPASGFNSTADEVTGELADQLATVTAKTIADAPAMATAEETSAAVSEALGDLSDGAERTHLGAALHGAMNTARVETLRAGPVGAVYASELNDSNTCSPCFEINGRWLGNTDDMATVEASYPGGAYGGYVGCLGGIRCRGTVVGVWREGHDSVNAPQSPLAVHIKSGERTATVLGGGMSARTELVTFNDGGEAIRKTVLNDDLRPPVEAQDAEELAASLAERLGIDAPDVQRSGKSTVYMEYVAEGQTGMERYGWYGDIPESVQNLADSDAGRRIGLFDIAIGNVDRNGGNWLISDRGALTAIDHGSAFVAPTASFGIDDVMAAVTGPNNVFAHALQGSRNYSRADLEHVRQVLANMLPTFQRLGRVRWYNDARVRLGLLEEHATGEGSMW